MERYHTRDYSVWPDTLIHSNLIDSLYDSTSTGTPVSPMTDGNTDKALLDRIRDIFYSKFRKLKRQLEVSQSSFKLLNNTLMGINGKVIKLELTKV